MNYSRVYWMDTDGGEPGDGAWFWNELDSFGDDIGEPHGPFESAVDAGSDARKAIVSTANKLQE